VQPPFLRQLPPLVWDTLPPHLGEKKTLNRAPLLLLFLRRRVVIGEGGPPEPPFLKHEPVPPPPPRGVWGKNFPAGPPLFPPPPPLYFQLSGNFLKTPRPSPFTQTRQTPSPKGEGSPPAGPRVFFPPP